MIDREIVVTLSQAIQIGPDEWKQHKISRIFSSTRSLRDMLSWAEAEGLINPQISDLQFSEFTGKSI